MKIDIVVASLATLALLFPGATFSQPIRISPDQEKALGIADVEVREGGRTALEGLSAQVAVPAQQLHVVSAPLGGLLERAFVATDQAVKKGQVLARVQSPALADLQHTFLQAATQLQLARSDLERDEQLFKEGLVAERRLLATRAHFQEVSADLAERTQALRLAGLADDDLRTLRSGQSVGTAIELRAPVSGVVLEQLAAPGQRLEPAAPVFRVAQPDPLWLEIQVPLAKLSTVAVGASVLLEGRPVGKVISVGRSISPNQTVLARAEVRAPARPVRPGQFVEVSISAPPQSGQWLVPNASVVRSAGSALVFVRTAEGYRAQKVRVVREGAEETLLEAPLRAGERIAAKGVSSLKAALLGIGAS